MFDAIVVGARCAGSPLSALLARKGHKVLLLDKSVFPQEYVLSNHTIWTGGIEFLHKWGLLDKIKKANTPAIVNWRVDFGGLVLNGTPSPAGEVNASYAPRRAMLDKLLVDNAVDAGAELREGFSVEELVFDGNTVVGIRGRERDGKFVAEKARIVIGADGTNSIVARSVNAEEYNCKDPIAMTYWAYWSGVPKDDVDLEFYLRLGRTVYVVPTNDDLTLIGVNWGANELDEINKDREGNYHKVLKELTPGVAERMSQGKRESAFVGGARPNYFRKPFGPGWALVGDASSGYEPYVAQGIANSFRQAEYLAEDLDRVFSNGNSPVGTLEGYEKRRNDFELPYYDLACQFAAQAAPPDEMLQLLGAVSASQAATDSFLGNFAQTTSPAEFFAPENIGKIMGAAKG